tara:strand:- start:675 stop:1121 length:447 start_codon:yes stop_codon:yes gene_type:complete
MIIIELDDLDNLNTSLQVGDAIYATPTSVQNGAEDSEAYEIGKQYLVGILRKIETIYTPHPVNASPIVFSGVGEKPIYKLHVDEQLAGITSSGGTGYIPRENDFLMFSKYSQKSGEVAGYYARANFINNSKKKAEIFAVSSEIVINSK